MKILGLISSPQDPASRIRIIQYVDMFKKTGEQLETHFFHPLKEANPARWSHRFRKITAINEWRTTNFVKTFGRLPLLVKQLPYDLVWQNRLLLINHFFSETLIKKPVVFDFDDAIWINEGAAQLNKKLKRSEMIFAGNDYLASYAVNYNKNVHVIPSTVDTNKLFPLGVKNEIFTIGWIGTESNFQYLEMIRPLIVDFVTRNKDSRCIIVSSTPPEHFPFDNERMIFRKWSEERENEDINDFSIGLMPLIDSEWARGKCSYKMLQYMACGKPVIVSPVGTNKTILLEERVGIGAGNDDEWMNAFQLLKDDASFYEKCAQRGRQLAEKNYSCEIWAGKIITLLKMVL